MIGIRIGDILITECTHGGLWLAKDGGGGMQVNGKTLVELQVLLEKFFDRNM